ncbi:MAG: hypothetical protein MZV64_58115 [Ignavibacteriales bacterium]|nr:hypothetical protein [Ignavibacteriales bacterium]
MRSDWTKLAKEFQVELYQKVFDGVEVEDWIRDEIQKLKSGKFDDKLDLSKTITKRS